MSNQIFASTNSHFVHYKVHEQKNITQKNDLKIHCSYI